MFPYEVQHMSEKTWNNLTLYVFRPIMVGAFPLIVAGAPCSIFG